jgi:small subunit ribosomal protein S13
VEFSSICSELKLDPATKVSDLAEEQLELIRSAVAKFAYDYLIKRRGPLRVLAFVLVL